MAFGEPLDVQYRFADAKVVLTLDADPFGVGQGHFVYAGDFLKRRRSLSAGEMNRFYAVESAPIAAGMRADHRLPVRASQVETIARALAAELGVADERVELPESTRKWLHAVADDLRKADNQGKASSCLANSSRRPSMPSPMQSTANLATSARRWFSRGRST